MRLNAEKDDNAALKRQVTSLQGAVRRATLKPGDPAGAAALAAALTANAVPGSAGSMVQSEESLASLPD